VGAGVEIILNIQQMQEKSSFAAGLLFG